MAATAQAEAGDAIVAAQATAEALATVAAEQGLDAETVQATAEAAAAELAGLQMEATEAAMDNCSRGYEGETVYVHQHAGLEGPLAAILGKGFSFATEDAVNEINANGGICGATLEVVYRETMYDVEQEVAAYEEARAFDPPPAVLLTYGSGATIALKDRVIEDEIVHIVAGLESKSIYVPRNGYTVGAAPIYPDQFAGFISWLNQNWADVKPESAGDEIVVGVIGWANAFGAGAITPQVEAFAEEIGVTILPLEQQIPDPAGDPTGQIQSLVLQGANVIYNQNLSFSATQVIGTIRALGLWDQLIVGGVNWTGNIDVINFLGENAAIADGYYAIYPSAAWNDTDNAGVQQALAAFEAGGYPETDKSNTYLLTYGTFYALKDIFEKTINDYGFENLTGANVLASMQDMGYINVIDLFRLDVRGENRAPRDAQIRRATWNGEAIEYIAVTDTFELPDMRPPAQ
jgi:branched-chain amino acid transport system substrate-binding protein